jgi:ankyrin repeat protein
MALEKLFEAVKADNLDLLKGAIKQCEEERQSLNAEYLYHGTALMYAALLGRKVVVEELIAKLLEEFSKRDPDDPVNALKEALNKALISAVVAGKAGVVEVLLAKGADVNAVKDGKTVLMLAVDKDNVDTSVVQVLLTNRANVDAVDGDGNTALILAARLVCVNEIVVRALIDAKANLDTVDKYGQTALILVAKGAHENASVVRALIDAGADVNIVDDSSNTALMWAVKKGHADASVVQRFVNAKANLNAEDKDGRTALISAVMEGGLGVVRALIARRNDIVDNDGNIIQHKINLGIKYFGKTALMWAAESVKECSGDIVRVLVEADVSDEDKAQALMLAAKKGHSDVVRVLVEADVSDEGKAQALMLAAKGGHAKAVRVLVKKANVTAKDKAQALISAAGNGHLEVVQVLMEAGANLNDVDDLGQTALISAVMEGKLGVVRALIARRNNIVDNDGNIIQYKIDLGMKYLGNTALMWAAKKGHKGVVEMLVEADVSDEDKAQALIYAAENGHLGVVLVLVGAGVNVNAVDEHGRTGLMRAAERGHLRVVQALIARRNNIVDNDGNIIQPKIDLNAKGDNGWTALMLAARAGHENAAAVVQALVGAGVNVNAVDNQNNTALMLAARAGHEEVVKALINAKADVNAVNDYGQTALILAARAGHEKVVQALIDAGARVDIEKMQKSESYNGIRLGIRRMLETKAAMPGDASADSSENASGAPSYPNTQRALCLASAAAFTSGAYFLLAQSAVSTMMWGPVPVLYLALVGCAAVGALLAWGLTTVYKDGFNDVAHSFYNWLGIDQDGPDAITVGS